jgi:hypothetical protein
MTPSNFTTNNVKLIILSILLAFVVNSASAQGDPLRFSKRVIYRGVDGSFGGTSTTISSDIAKLNGLKLKTEGGSLGFVFGTEAIRTTSRVGFYYSASSVKQTIDQFVAGQSVNIYPIAIMKPEMSRVEFYLSVGGDYNIYKFAGTYLETDGQSQPGNVWDLYKGKVSQLSINGGIGVEYKVYDYDHFLHIYGVVKTGLPVMTSSSTEQMEGTKIGQQLYFNVGIRCGLVK